MDDNKRIKICFLCLFCFLIFPIHSDPNEFYNSLIDDLLYSCSYGYKGTNLETGEVDFTNYDGESGYIVTNLDSNFYIPSYKGFFKVINDNNEIYYTRNGDFIKRGNDYYLSSGNYKLETIVEECEEFLSNKKTLIYHPTESSSIVRDGFLFRFSEVEAFEEQIIPNRLEVPNIDCIKILLKFKTFLNQSPEQFPTQIEIVNRMLDILIADKMHEYYIERSFLQFDVERYELENNLITLDQIRFIYSTNWARTFRDYIKMLYI